MSLTYLMDALEKSSQSRLAFLGLLLLLITVVAIIFFRRSSQKFKLILFSLFVVGVFFIGFYVLSQKEERPTQQLNTSQHTDTLTPIQKASPQSPPKTNKPARNSSQSSNQNTGRLIQNQGNNATNNNGDNNTFNP